MGNALHPTGECFEDSTLEFVRLLSKNRRRFDDPNLALVHGICRMPDGTLYSHAWIEMDGMAIFSGIMRGVRGYAEATIQEFNAAYDVQERTRYTGAEAQKTALLHNDCPPPWEKKYLVLCKNYRP